MFLAATALTATMVPAPVGAVAGTAQPVLIDTDIGDDIDDAFAVALALQSPELQVLGVTTTFGDTELRARLLRRFLAETGHGRIPVAAGPRTPPAGNFTQRAYAEAGPPPRGADVPGTGGEQAALELFRRVVRAHPHEVTLIALGPLTTVESWIDRDPATFRLLRRVVMMGGAIDEGYHAAGAPGKRTQPEPEWNIHNDPAGFRKLLQSGVPVTLLPLDSTQIPLDRARQEQIFADRSPLTANLAALEREWGQGTPTLFDPVTVATAADPALCPAQPMHLRVDAAGNTVREEGKANAAVCLRSERESFLNVLVKRLTTSPAQDARP